MDRVNILLLLRDADGPRLSLFEKVWIMGKPMAAAPRSAGVPPVLRRLLLLGPPFGGKSVNEIPAGRRRSLKSMHIA